MFWLLDIIKLYLASVIVRFLLLLLCGFRKFKLEKNLSSASNLWYFIGD